MSHANETIRGRKGVADWLGWEGPGLEEKEGEKGGKEGRRHEGKGRENIGGEGGGEGQEGGTSRGAGGGGVGGGLTPEVLLEGLEDALQVEVVSKPLDGRDTLAPASLLDSDVDFGLVASLLLRVGEGV